MAINIPFWPKLEYKIFNLERMILQFLYFGFSYLDFEYSIVNIDLQLQKWCSSPSIAIFSLIQYIPQWPVLPTRIRMSKYWIDKLPLGVLSQSSTSCHSKYYIIQLSPSVNHYTSSNNAHILSPADKTTVDNFLKVYVPPRLSFPPPCMIDWRPNEVPDSCVMILINVLQCSVHTPAKPTNTNQCCCCFPPIWSFLVQITHLE